MFRMCTAKIFLFHTHIIAKSVSLRNLVPRLSATLICFAHANDGLSSPALKVGLKKGLLGFPGHKENEAEIDLFAFKNGKRIGFEFKYTETPKITKSMLVAIEDLKLDHLYVIFPGTRSFPLATNITACGLEALKEIKI